MLLLGLFLLIIRCMFPVKSVRAARRQQRPRARRPNRIYDAQPRPRPTSGQRSHPTPSPAQVWTTPISDLEGQTITQYIAQMSFDSAQRSPVQAPPTYDQAIGRQVFK